MSSQKGFMASPEGAAGVAGGDSGAEARVADTGKTGPYVTEHGFKVERQTDGTGYWDVVWWDVVWPDGAADGCSYADEVDAQEYADGLDYAFHQGIEFAADHNTSPDQSQEGLAAATDDEKAEWFKLGWDARQKDILEYVDATTSKEVTPPTPMEDGSGLAADLVHESIRNIESALMEVDQIENEIGGGIAGLRQAYAVQLGALNTLRQDLIVVAGELAANQSAESSERFIFDVTTAGMSDEELGWQPRGWQPIGTAPKKGLILGAWMAAGCWSLHPMFWSPTENDGRGAWVDNAVSVSRNPTHWMPLAAPPTEGGES